MRVATFALVLLISLVSGGCMFGKKKAARVLPRPPQPALAKPAPVIAPPSDVIIPSAEPPSTPAPVVKAQEKPPKEKAPEPQPEPPPQPVKRKRTPVRQVTEAPPKPAEPEAPVAAGTTTPEPATVAPPQLREILSPERQHQYESEYGSSVGRARAVIGRTTGRTNLTEAQVETLNRINTFLKQAEDSRKDDLGTAWQLARRADLLSQELAESLK